MRRVTFPHMGNYFHAFEGLVRDLGCEPVLPEATNKKTVELGVQHSPEFICFPCKINIGNLLDGVERGADSVLMFASRGECRMRYYAALQRKILDELGKDIDFFIFDAKNFLKQFKKLSNKNFVQILLAAIPFWRRTKLVEYIEDLGYKYRPRAVIGGEVTKIQKECFTFVKYVHTARSFKFAKQKVNQRFSMIAQKPIGNSVTRVGIVGEIYSLLEPFVNQEIEKILGNLGIEVHKKLRLSSFITHGLPWNKRREIKTAWPYLKFRVGGHGRASVADALGYHKKGFDGVVHIAVFGCMPEVTVRPILAKISQEKNFPIMSLSVDEHSGKAGIQTRVEAFVDLVKGKRILEINGKISNLNVGKMANFKF
ncbi:MAG: hypothetical protein ACD_63C00051G0004 [uncultured bacterium]|nr:MAG: hypothetical protein ACD_63C00051G0004 [uncultured bacterium]